MKNKAMRRVIVLVGLLAAFVVAGCSSNAPCNTDPSAVESARAELQSVEGQVSSAQGELDTAKTKLTSLQTQMNNLPDVDELESRLEVLKKGSGR